VAENDVTTRKKKKLLEKREIKSLHTDTWLTQREWLGRPEKRRDRRGLTRSHTSNFHAAGHGDGVRRGTGAWGRCVRYHGGGLGEERPPFG